MFCATTGHSQGERDRAAHREVNWACGIEGSVDERYPEAERVVLAMDNLHTHSPASLYGTFPTAEKPPYRQAADPLHAQTCSWLNIAEIEFSLLSRQCLHRRLPDFETLRSEVEAWREPRGVTGRRIGLPFDTEDARIKLQQLYPSLQE